MNKKTTQKKKIKVTLMIGRGHAKHNDRNFNLDLSKHIDNDKISNNKYWLLFDTGGARYDNFEEAEKAYYEKHYRATYEAIKARYIKNGNRNRVPTFEAWMKKHSPYEAILQVGDFANRVDTQVLVNAAQALFVNLEKYPNLKLLDAALHVDETTDHIHFRYIIEGRNKAGIKMPLLEAGLAEMGIERADISKKSGRYNNRMQTLTAEIRNTFIDEVEKQGIEVDREPRKGVKHQPTIHQAQLMEEICGLERERDAVQVQLEEERERTEHAIEAIRDSVEHQKRALEAAQQAEMDRMNAEHEKRKKALLKRMAKEEKELKGQVLADKDLKTLAGKKIWSEKDKENVLKTASQSAKNAEAMKRIKEENAELRADKKKLIQENKALEEKIPSFDVKKLNEALAEKVETLKKILKVIIDWVKDKGLFAELKTHCKKKGINLDDQKYLRDKPTQTENITR